MRIILAQGTILMMDSEINVEDVGFGHKNK